MIQRLKHNLSTGVFVFLLAVGICMDSIAEEMKIGHFQIDVTIPLNHRCMGVLPQKSKTIADNLDLHGFVLLGDQDPVVFVAVDWCEIRNKSYDQWRERLAKVAKTGPERVLLSSLHQHDAPVIDAGAQELLDQVGLIGELFDPAFHEDAISRAEVALAQAIEEAKPLTHLGYAESMVREVASNRRVVDGTGKVSFARGSSSGRDPFFRETDAGLIDPMLRTISFWSHDQCVVEYHAYATHPMSYYGRGEVTSDFVGLARKRLARLDRSIHPIYASGCSGDVTAGKYNDGSQQAREELTTKIFDAMLTNRNATKKIEVTNGWRFRSIELELQYTQTPNLQKDFMLQELKDTNAPVEKRILAAMGLASWNRTVENSKPIDMPCIDFGVARVILFPGEAFVGYQHLAQKLSGEVPVIPIGYGECWTGYVPTSAAFDDGFNESWLWVAPGAEEKIQQGLSKLLNGTHALKDIR